MSAILRRCFASDANWYTIHTQYPSLTDAKIEDFAPVQKCVKQLRTVGQAKDLEIYLIAQRRALKASPSLYDTSVQELDARIIEVRSFIAANKQ